MSTKRHLLTDARGRPVRALLTAGQVHDQVPAAGLLGELGPAQLVADRGYGSRAATGVGLLATTWPAAARKP